MSLQILKRAYDASRELRGHKQDEAAEEVGKSSSMINQVLAGNATSQPTIDGIKNYIYETGMIKTASELESFIEAEKEKLATTAG